MKVEIKELELKDYENQWLNKDSYKDKGLYLIKDKYTDRGDFIFYDGDFVNAICPIGIFNKSIEYESIKSEVLEDVIKSDSYTNDFILEFARILLNKK